MFYDLYYRNVKKPAPRTARILERSLVPVPVSAGAAPVQQQQRVAGEGVGLVPAAAGAAQQVRDDLQRVQHAVQQGRVAGRAE